MPLTPNKLRAFQLPPSFVDVRTLTGRMYINGTNIYDENDYPWIGRGLNFGHEELAIDTDMQTVADLLGNVVRIPVRMWGTYGGVITDGYDPTSPVYGLIATAYQKDKILRFKQAKAAGLKTILAPDSNCGQAERVGDPICDLTNHDGTGPPETFWTVNGSVRRQNHINSLFMWATVLLGYVDMYELLVEPFPSATIPTGNLVFDVWLFQTQCRNAILAADPAALFIVGPAPAYGTGGLAGWFNPAWAAQNNTIYTANMLSNALADTATAVAAKVKIFTQFRHAHKVPMFVQQIGTEAGPDPSPYPLEAYGLSLFNNAVGGSIGWTKWEMVGAGTVEGAASYGMFVQSAVNGPRVFLPQRASVFTAACQATRNYS